MECLVEEGHANAFLGPLMRASERGCTPVVQRGCRDMELCLAFTAATSTSQLEVVSYLLSHIPISALSVEILKGAAERSSSGSLDGVAFLLHSNFLGDPNDTYSVADSIDDEAVLPAPYGGEAAFLDGRRQGEVHFYNMARISKWGKSPIRFMDLPAPLRVAIGYLPLYTECVGAGGCLLSQKHRGQLVEAALRLGGVFLDELGQRSELLAVLEHRLPPFFL